MQLTTVFRFVPTIILLTLQLASAGPLPFGSTSTAALQSPLAGNVSTNSSVPKTFVLRTNRTSSQTFNEFENLYVVPYHTGAGLNDVRLYEKSRSAWNAAIMNGTCVQFDIGAYPFWLEMRNGKWQDIYRDVQINAHLYPPTVDFCGFYFGDMGLWYRYQSFAGWKVCDVNLRGAVPQLFWKKVHDNDKLFPLLDGCMDVLLMPEYI